MPTAAERLAQREARLAAQGARPASGAVKKASGTVKKTAGRRAAPATAPTPVEPTEAHEEASVDTPEAEPEAETQPALPVRPEGGGRRTLADEDDTVNLLLYGKGGTGKTTDLASLANLGKVIYINAESGIKKGPLTRLGIKTENIELFPLPGEQLNFDRLDELFWELKADLETGRSEYVGTCWDSITDIHKTFLRVQIDKRVQKALRTGRGGETAQDPFFTDLADYGVMTEQLRLLLRRYRDLPCHFGVSALERRELDDDGKVTYSAALTPALASDLFGYVDLVGHTEVMDLNGAETFLALFRPLGKYDAKDRFGVTPRRLTDPTFERIIAYVNEELTVDSDEIQIEAMRNASENSQPDGDEPDGDE